MFRKNKVKFKACNNVCNFSCSSCPAYAWNVKSDRDAMMFTKHPTHSTSAEWKNDKHMNVTHTKRNCLIEFPQFEAVECRATDEEVNKRKNKIKIAHRMTMSTPDGEYEPNNGKEL